MMTPHLGLALLLALASTMLPAEAQPPTVKPRYERFLLQHVFGGMSENKCDSVIRDRKISKDNNDCKDVNTFVLAPQAQVQAVCNKAGIPKDGNLFESTNPFPVVICKLKSGVRHPKCEYIGKKSTRKITLGCSQGWPVHYQEDTLVIP